MTALRIILTPLRFVVDVIADMIWGAGNPMLDTYSNDWSKSLNRDTGEPVHKVAQSFDEFALSVGDVIDDAREPVETLPRTAAAGGRR